ncbi:hypothetical protein AAFP30_15605 [Gordonia sp. CPCC 205515]|uniref:hypothetical protein n=1 Tax=Gordonia sp. CPCC 205515 TaxID=3140791 RepID=UPI003AF36EB7
MRSANRPDEQANTEWVPCATGLLPADIVRRRRLSDDALVGRMSRASYYGLTTTWWMMGVIVLSIITPVLVTSGVPRNRGDWTALGQLLVIGFFCIAFVVWGATRVRGRRPLDIELPEGTTIFADSGASWIGVGYRGCYTGVSRGHGRTRHIADVAVISADGSRLLVPNELTDTTTPSEPIRAPQPNAVNTHLIADDKLTARLTSAFRRHPGLSLATTVLIAYVPVTLGAVRAQSGSFDVTDIAAVTTIAGIGLAMIAYQVIIGMPRRNRRLVPPGTPIAAEFGPEQIGVRLGERTEIISTATIRRAHVRCGTLQISSARRLFTMTIPLELVPDETIAHLRERYGKNAR